MVYDICDEIYYSIDLHIKSILQQTMYERSSVFFSLSFSLYTYFCLHIKTVAEFNEVAPDIK